MSPVQTYLANFRRPDFLVGDAYVGGAWLPGARRTPVIDPATDEAFATAAACEPDQGCITEHKPPWEFAHYGALNHEMLQRDYFIENRTWSASSG